MLRFEAVLKNKDDHVEQMDRSIMAEDGLDIACIRNSFPLTFTSTFNRRMIAKYCDGTPQNIEKITRRHSHRNHLHNQVEVYRLYVHVL